MSLLSHPGSLAGRFCRPSQAEAKAQQAEAKAQQAEAKAQQALIELQAIYASRSWRWTAPLRAMGRIVRQFRMP
jgi:hypothetical protein